MRPHKLVMKAFGPFAKETTVDFDLMGDNIYLISGDTGSGKTTIFDGIIYALYGTASGGARSGLGTEALHSDFAKAGVHRDELKVELTFSNAGRVFTVSRSMNWGQKGDSKVVSKKSVLSENGNTIVWGKGREDKDDVTLKITELLGLDADQFRRIIMLAQGEFQQFLSAKSDERGVILGKIYDNRQHQDFQLRLKAASALLEDQDEEAVREAKTRLEMFRFPDDIDEETRRTISIDHPALQTSMNTVIARIKEKRAGLEEKIQQLEKDKQQKEAQKTKAETCNGLLASLEKNREDRRRLDTQSHDFDELRELVRLAECAREVLPYEEQLRQAAKRLNDNLASKQKLENEQKDLTQKISESQTHLDTVQEENQPKIEELKQEQTKLSEALPRYEDLETAEKAHNTALEDLKKARQENGGAAEKVSSLEKRVEELRSTLTRLADAGESAVTVAAEKRSRRSDRKTELNSIQNSITEVRKLEKETESLKHTLLDAQEKACSANKTYSRLYQAFIQGQAGILAQELRQELETKPEAVCPVCGSVHTSADIHGFAVPSADSASEKEVDAAHQAFEAARAKEAADRESCSKKESELISTRKALLEKTESLLSVSEWEELISGTALSDALSACESELEEANREYQQAAQNKKEKDEAAKEEENVKEQLAKAKQESEYAAGRQQDAGIKEASTEARVNQLKQQLQGYPDSKTVAERELLSLGGQVQTLEEQIKNAQNDLAALERRKSENGGKLSELLSQNEKYMREKTDSEKNYSGCLSQQGFADSDEYHRALSPQGELLNLDSLRGWLEGRKNDIEQYDGACRKLNAAIEELEKSTSGMQHEDTQLLEAEIQTAAVQLKELRSEAGSLDNMAESNQKTYDVVRDIQRRRDGYERVRARLSPMSKTADGKYAFSRYVLTGFFRRIVEQANVHLESITDGEYCLIPKETGDGRSNTGLDLKVLNTITNIERDTGSLSGGQSFIASLSLALGLSSVVQMESSSCIQIDSMFIDEGFGSLDGDILNRSINALQRLSSDTRQVGIISHVSQLGEVINKKIHVVKTEGRGSSVRIETDL